jgi:hypothetical protein
MFGYVLANRDELDQESRERYGACYCGLCRTLKQSYGQAGSMTLTYDMAFLILLLSSLYEPENSAGEERCAVHPVKAHLYWQNEFTQYAADMNIALAYHNCMDDWKDDKNILKFAQAALLKKKYAVIEKQYPRQCASIAGGLRALGQLEKERVYNPDAAANCFGSMMSELFVYKEDRWAPSLRRMAAALGRFIYMMDACEDIGQDIKKNRYNPLSPAYRQSGFDKYCMDILKIHISECAMEFEKLPLVQDVSIMRNILYSGVWTKYYARRGPDQALLLKDSGRKEILTNDGSI